MMNKRVKKSRQNVFRMKKKKSKMMIENDEENRGIFVSLSNTQKLDLGRCSVAFHQSNRGSSLETGPTESINM